MSEFAELNEKNHDTFARNISEKVLTLHPELFDLAVNLSGFESDTECSQCDDRKKENLACVPLQEVAQLTQLILQPCPDPHRRPLTFRFALKK